LVSTANRSASAVRSRLKPELVISGRCQPGAVQGSLLTPVNEALLSPMAERGWTHHKLQQALFSIAEDFCIENDHCAYLIGAALWLQARRAWPTVPTPV
jgi:hypothetical protein